MIKNNYEKINLNKINRSYRNRFQLQNQSNNKIAIILGQSTKFKSIPQYLTQFEPKTNNSNKNQNNSDKNHFSHQDYNLKQSSYNTLQMLTIQNQNIVSSNKFQNAQKKYKSIQYNNQMIENYRNNQRCFKRPISSQFKSKSKSISHYKSKFHPKHSKIVNQKADIKNMFNNLIKDYKNSIKSNSKSQQEKFNISTQVNFIVKGQASDVTQLAKSKINLQYLQAFQQDTSQYSYLYLKNKQKHRTLLYPSQLQQYQKIIKQSSTLNNYQLKNQTNSHQKQQFNRDIKNKKKIRNYNNCYFNTIQNVDVLINNKKRPKSMIQSKNCNQKMHSTLQFSHKDSKQIVTNHLTKQAQISKISNNNLIEPQLCQALCKSNKIQKKKSKNQKIIIFKSKKRYSQLDGIRCLSLGLSQSNNSKHKKQSQMILQIEKKIQQKKRISFSTLRQNQQSKLMILSTNSFNKNLKRIRKQIIFGNNKKNLNSKIAQQVDYTYIKRLKAFFDFIFKINYSNKLYVSLKLLSQNQLENSINFINSNANSNIKNDNNTKPKLENLNQQHFLIENQMYLSTLIQQSLNASQTNFNFIQKQEMKTSMKSYFYTGKYKAYVGRGNNCLLIKSILKRRFWFQITNNINDGDIMFCWTQNPVNQFHQKQLNKHNELLSSQDESKVSTIIAAGGYLKTQSNKGQNENKENQKNLQLNKKLLSGDGIWKVEHYIDEVGYTIPFVNNYEPTYVSNHIPGNNCIGSKKKLHCSLYHYYNFLKKSAYDYIPKTYHINNANDFSYKKFVLQNKPNPYSKENENKIWIIKPAQQTNRGTGIRLAKFNKISSLINSVSFKDKKHPDGQPYTYVIQQYISKPFLYNGRKIDFRHYILLTSVNGILKGYWYKQGYIRTSSQSYNIEDLQNIYVHLTNDAIQKNHQKYGYYQAANKLSYSQFQRYLDLNYPKKRGIHNIDLILQHMKQIMKDVIKANFKLIDPLRKQNNFEIFGIDFMIDRQFRPWLIQINSNPCYQIVCPLLSRIIPTLLQNSFRIGLDPLLPPRQHYPVNKRYFLNENILKNLKYELIFDEEMIQSVIEVKKVVVNYNQVQEQDEYQNEGKQLDDMIQI